MKQSVIENSETGASEKILTSEENYEKGFNHQYGFNGHEKDLQEAYKYYKLAAEGGRIDAENSLGEIFEQNCNYAEAFKWYRLALKRGDKFAAEGHKRTAKKLGYEVVVNVLRNMNEITRTVSCTQSFAALLPSDSPLAGKGDPNNRRDDDNPHNHVSLSK